MPTTIACGQFVPVPKDISANVAIMRRQMTEAAQKGAKLIVFPELCLTGYISPEEIPPLAVSSMGQELAPLRLAAQELGIAFALGFAEKAPGGAIYNSMGYFDDSGKVKAVYHKTHLWDTEKLWAKPGESVNAFDTALCRTGMWVCYDTRFPEVARLLAIDGAALALVATAWLGPADEWETLVRARALDGGFYIVASALQGRYDKFVFNGRSLIVDPHGHVLAAVPEGEEGVITASYDENILAAFRSRIPLLAHRRTDIYQNLLHKANW